MLFSEKIEKSTTLKKLQKYCLDCRIRRFVSRPFILCWLQVTINIIIFIIFCNNALTTASTNTTITDPSDPKDNIENEAAQLRTQITNKVTAMQEPNHCAETEYLLCSFPRCGFGCTINHISQCLLHSYIEQKTMVLSNYNLKYLLPVSKCQAYYEQNRDQISKVSSTINFNVGWDSEFKKPWIPEYAHHFVTSANMQYPNAWFVGILNAYLFRGFEPEVTEYFDEKSLHLFGKKFDEVKFDACVHIRRTDKVYGSNIEALEFSVREYVNELDHFFVMKDGKRIYHGSYDKKYGINVYLATDEPEVIKEANEKFGQYAWFYNNVGAESANVRERVQESGMKNVIFDLLMLTKGEYFVGTLSSNIGRLVLQLKANDYVDPAQYVFSLDEKWYGGL